MNPTNQAAIDDALEYIWGGGIDYALSPDFKELSPDEKDALYIRYRDNLIAKAKRAIEEYATQRAVEARIDEWQRLDVGVNISKDYPARRLAKLRNQDKDKA